MSAIDLTADRLMLAMVVVVESVSDSGTPTQVVWCGPRSRTGSGIAVKIPGIGVVQAEGRLGDAKIVRTVGPLSNHVQTLSSMDLTLSVSGDGDDLLRLAQTGRWEGRRVSAWYVELSAFGFVDQTKDPREAFRGTVDECPTCEPGRIRVSSTAGLLGIERQWCMAQLPTTAEGSVSGWTHDDDAVLAPNPWTGGNVCHSWHPRAYHVPTPKAGTFVGPVYGSGEQLGVWREVAFYGYQYSPDSPSNAHAFFFVSPQFGCWVEELWWEDTDNQALRGVDTDTGNPTWVEAFDNADPTMGPVGTCCRLSYYTPAQVSAFQTAPYPRAFARIRGAGYARRYGTVDEGGSIHFLSTSGAQLRDRDDQIILDALTDAQLLDLGSEMSVFGPDAIAEFSTTAPTGPTTPYNYRHLACAVPAEITTAPPQARAVLGDLMALVSSDLVELYDDAAGGQRLWPRRRRPNPSQTEAEFTIRDEDLLTGHPAAMRAFRLTDDPGRTYANRIVSTSPEYGVAPETVASGDPADVIDPTTTATDTHDDTTEQGANAFGAVLRREARGRWWMSTLVNDGWQDAVEMAAASRSQPIKGVRVELGWPWLRLSLLDAVEYRIDGLEDVGVGHIREIEETLSTQSVAVVSVHAHFFGGGNQADPKAPGQVEEE